MAQHKGSCHCGKVQFEAELDLSKGISCNCSMCQRKGSILAFVPEGQFHLLSGADNLTDYQFNKKAIHHTFCSTCGVTAFATGSDPGSGAPMKAINLRCIEGIDIHTINITEVDGRSF